MSIALRALTDQGMVINAAEVFKYPGGEISLKAVKSLGKTTWVADVRGAEADDLVTAAMLADVAQERCEPMILLLPYLPAARADRGTPAGAWVYSNFVNQIYADQVIGIDPHSETVTQYINNLTVLDPWPLLQRALMGRQYDGVIAPDKGAVERAYQIATQLGVEIYYAEKHRDFDTGEILSIEMTEKLPEMGRYLVVDDICDGGGTFVGLANSTGLHSTQLGLWVTHGIFSGKADKLHKYYQHVYTSDSHPGHNRIGAATTQVPTLTYMLQNIAKEFK